MAPPPDSPNYHPLVRGVARALRRRCGVPAGATVIIACSGGADSVALVRAVALLAERRRWRLWPVVAHVQHHLRGEAAEADAAFVSQLAGQLGLGYERRDIRPSDEVGNLEASARRLRYQALAEVALARRAGFVATAHHADDQLETMLMRLIRGTGVRGLRGIAWRRRLRTGDERAKVYAVRPMLEATREQVREFLDTLDQPWREDATNRDTTRTRARLRNDIVPLIKAIRADAPGKAVALGEQFRDLHQLVEQQVEAVSQGDTLDAIARREARGLNKIVLTQWLRRALIHAGVEADRVPGHALRPVIDAVRDHVGGTRSFDFANGVRIEVDAEHLSVIKRP
ncbi:MAG: tRNA lysidine(34) synthetase TilS [Phycisphaeraceae bacterium]